VLENTSILVVEDEPLTALYVAGEVEGARGTVVGPASSVSQAIELINKSEVDGAVLDVHLTDGNVAPVATFDPGRSVSISLRGRMNPRA
jgi:CheY-like chemotaxis protein